MPKLTNLDFRPKSTRHTRTMAIRIYVEGYQYGKVASHIEALNVKNNPQWALVNHQSGEVIGRHPDLAALVFWLHERIGEELTKVPTTSNEYHDYGLLLLGDVVIGTYQDTPEGKKVAHTGLV